MSTDAAGATERLRVLIVIARYPPHHVGGYELRCRDTARELARRGHQVTVLTSREGARGVEDDDGVRVVRRLSLWPDGVPGRRATLRFLLATRGDCRAFRREVRSLEADVVHYWHQAGLSSALLALPRPEGCGALCDVSSDWLQDAALTGGNWFRIWEYRPASFLKRLAKGFVRPFAGLFLGAPTRRPSSPPGRTYFTSHDKLARYREAGVALEDPALITSGIDLRRFRYVAERPDDGTVYLLFLGRMKRRKGLHTAVLALHDLPSHVRLRAVGAVEDPAYLAEVAELGRATGVMERIELAQPVAHSEVPKLLARSHVLLFLSEEPEAFSRLILEAFAVGTPVVGTTLGGSAEVLVEERTGLTFDPGNAHQLASQLNRLLGDDALRAALVRRARGLVQQRYAIGFTVDQIEGLLRQAAAAAV